MSEPDLPAGQNNQERVPLLLVLDTSSSMARPEQSPRIGELEDALRRLVGYMREQPGVRSRMELALITFDSAVEVRRGLGSSASSSGDDAFTPVWDIRIPPLTTGGWSLLLPAVRQAVELARRRRETLQGQSVPCHRPIILVLTDGAPTDESGTVQGPTQCARLAAELRAAERARDCILFVVGVGDADEELLRILAPNTTYMLDTFDFGTIVQLVARSVVAVRADTSVEDLVGSVRESTSLRDKLKQLEETLS